MAMPAGRPRKEIDAEQVYKLARLGCTQKEIADFFNCDRHTIARNFTPEIDRARGGLNVSLRRAQVLRAVRDRSDTMLIHLGKVYLGQGHPGPAEELDGQRPGDDDGNPIEP
jgi:hypothetical protein